MEFLDWIETGESALHGGELAHAIDAVSQAWLDLIGREGDVSIEEVDRWHTLMKSTVMATFEVWHPVDDRPALCQTQSGWNSDLEIDAGRVGWSETVNRAEWVNHGLENER